MKSTLFRGADRIVSIGRDMDRRLAELGVPASKVVTIHDWTDADLVRPLDGPSSLRTDLGWGDDFVVMHSGNVGLSQDLDAVLDAAALLRDETDVRFAIVGEGASKDGLRRRAEREGLTNVEFLPYQPKASLAESLGAADVHLVTLKRGLAGYIVPSKVYGILAAGRPFVAAVEDGSEPALIVQEEACGLRVEPGDPEALAAAILRLRDDPVEREEMGRRARKALEDRFDRSISTEAYRSLLEDLAGN